MLWAKGLQSIPKQPKQLTLYFKKNKKQAAVCLALPLPVSTINQKLINWAQKLDLD
jgi:hypothetical protein